MEKKPNRGAVRELPLSAVLSSFRSSFPGSIELPNQLPSTGIKELDPRVQVSAV